MRISFGWRNGLTLNRATLILTSVADDDWKRMALDNEHSRWQFWIDVGGTFTDCIACAPDGALFTCKVLSSSVVKGRVGGASSKRIIVDPQRRDEPENFFAGYTVTLPIAHEGRADSTCFESIVKTSKHGRLEIEHDLPPHCIDAAYELAGGETAPVLGIRTILGIGLDQSIDDYVGNDLVDGFS